MKKLATMLVLGIALQAQAEDTGATGKRYGIDMATGRLLWSK
jgi:hypothetical protein